MKAKAEKNQEKRKTERMDRKINRKNKKLMMEKILSYSPMLTKGIEKYKNTNRKFTFFIVIGLLLSIKPILSLPFCILSIAFLIKMLQLVRYRNIYTIVKILGRDLAYRGIYNKGKIEDLIDEFVERYGKEDIEYYELLYMVKQYEIFIRKVEKVINEMSTSQKEEAEVEASSDVQCGNNVDFDNTRENSAFNKLRQKYSVKDYAQEINDKIPKFQFVYKNEKGEIKKINRAIEFFQDQNGEEASQNLEAGVLKSSKEEDKNLTVYLYKKSSKLQKSIL